MPNNSRKALGEAAEQRAKCYLEQQGLSWVASNFSCRLGELDLIMKEQNTLVFVEVRYRQSNAYGGALASIDQRKQTKVRRSAELWLQQQHLLDTVPVRFDVVAIEPNGAEWIKGAF